MSITIEIPDQIDRESLISILDQLTKATQESIDPSVRAAAGAVCFVQGCLIEGSEQWLSEQVGQMARHRIMSIIASKRSN